MKADIYNKLFQDEVNFSRPVVRIKRENGKYIAFNIKKPQFKHSFDSVEALLFAIGSPATRPSYFDNQTGEDIFKGK